MEQIFPSQHPNKRIRGPSGLDLWIKLWGGAMVLAGLSLIFIKAPWNSVLVTAAYGLALICGKRVYAMRLIGVWFSAFLFGASAVMIYYYTGIEANLVRRLYFFISFVFYIGLFTFLLTPDVKLAFGPSPIPKTPPPTLTSQEERRIKFWVRVVAVGMILEALIAYTFSDWFHLYGMPAESSVGAMMGLTAGLGLLFFRPNIGRRFGILVCLATWGGVMLSNFGKAIFGFTGYCYTFLLIILFVASFLFLLHPKTKAVFK